ncbi:MAG TPA: hypothetical protein VMF66_19625 [Candidatus Acidoferrum sp.]|nr:hypothetical protein [Candidatus Acidoferrum sp.]
MQGNTIRTVSYKDVSLLGVTSWVLLALAMFVWIAKPARGEPQRIYFVAATPPQSGSWSYYGAALYSLGSNRKLALVRQLFTVNNTPPRAFLSSPTPNPFTDFADDLHGHIYVASDRGLFVIHENDPTREDYVPLSNFDDLLCWGAVAGNAVPAAAQFCVPNKVVRVLARPADKTRVDAGSWSAFAFLQYGGENGGPFPMQPPKAEIAGTDLVMPLSSRPEVVLAKLPPRFAVEPSRRQLVWILASTDGYLVVWILPADMFGGTADSANPNHAEPLHALALNRGSGQWNEIELGTTVTSNIRAPVRIFGDWLVTTVMHWHPGPPATPGIENERGGYADQPLPDVRIEYQSQFLDLYIPGKIALQNLNDGRKFDLDTGQEDSEIIAIRSDGEMLYRVNDSIYSAEIVGSQITDPKLIVKDAGVPEVHWAFWAPGAGGKD